jgi:hypothetical protein
MKTAIRATIGAVLALAAVGAGASFASAADTISDSNFVATPHIASAETAEPVTGTIGFEQQVVGLLDITNYEVKYPIPAGATEAWTFVSPHGKESTPSQWNARAVLGLTEGGIMLPNISLTNQIVNAGGTPNGINAVKGAGGDYSIGIAFTKDGGVNLIPDSLYYGHIHVTAGSGEWTYTEVTCPTCGGGGEPTPTPTPSASGSATQSLSADVAAPPVVDGLLSMVAPASSTSALGNATIVSGKSTSTGTLGSFQIQDGRAASKPGWTLTTSSVGDFVNGATKIDKKYLGLAPKNVSGVPATLGITQAPGVATYPSVFAKLGAGNAGTTTLDADLTFVAPEGSPAGTYTSTLTVTLVSGS